MKLKQICSGIAASMLAVLCIGSVTASAYTADDVAAKARAAGWPESLIQAGYNQWATGNYSQEKLDAAYDSVKDFNAQSGEMICNMLGLDPEDYLTEESDDPQPTEPLETVTKADGTVEPRIAPSEFTKLTREEKQAYIDSLSEQSRKEFLASLTGDERKSLIKDLPAEDKAALIQSYIDTADNMGLNVTVDAVEGNNLSMTIRNEDGIVVDKAATGTSIDETGYSHTLPLAAAAGGVVLAVAGFAGLYYYIRKTEV
ncbi:MAG: hypothetical protein K5695_16845 [Oscillospiraceae bacterium]|nr:hypothetical protein [Oscillospiraceae bacterium]